MRTAWWAFGLAGLLGACGKADAPPGASAPDLSSPQAAFAGAMRAVEAGDLRGLTPYLTDEGSRRLAADLDAWRAMLVHPQGGTRLLARVPPPKDAAEADAIRRALAGDVGLLLRLYVAADPHPAGPGQAARTLDEGRRLEVLYPARDGSRRTVVLAKDGERWRVDRLDL